MNPETAVLIGGAFNAAIAGFHLAFWKLFRWREEVKRMSRVNAAILQVLNLRLIWLFIVFAGISFAFTSELAHTALGKTLMAAMTLFWVMRAIEQVVFFGLRETASKVFFALCFVGIASHAFAVLA